MARNQIALDQTKGGHIAKKFACPACSHKRFVRYYDFTDGQYLDAKYGRCDREEQCGYFEAPYRDLKDDYNAEKAQRVSDKLREKYKPKPQAQAQPILSVDRQLVQSTLQFYEQNILACYLRNLLGPDIANEVISRYFIGTGRGGATIFWQIDRFMRIRTGQRIMYQPTGKRNREISPVRLFKVEQGYTPCLFGEHLLYTVSDKLPIAIVESEKTAAIASAYLPYYQGKQVLWMASGGVNGLTADKIRALENKTIILVPDFSFHARATWGQIPMRKKRNEKGQNIPDPDGDPVDFVSYADKLRAIGCNVSFFDPAPDTWDSSDIGDVLLSMRPPKHITKPDFSKMVIGTPHEKRSETPENLPKFPSSTPPPILPNPMQEFSFRITEKGEHISIATEPNYLQDTIEKYLNKPQFVNLINSLDICEGTISQLIYDEPGNGNA